jgi:glycine/serine hydroxymethyltransferase
MIEIATLIDQTMQASEDEANLKQVLKRVKALTDRFVLYPEWLERYN